jgi:hypothetical protein
VLSAALLIAGSGCRAFVDLLDGDSVATVRLFATHAGTPNEDGFPDYGDSITTRVFTNDMGWQLSLSEVYVTTAEVRLVECAAETGKAIEMFWGACPEDFIGADDRDSLALGAVSIEDGSYCRVDVTFAPYLPSEQSADHLTPENTMIEGNTILLIGVARRGEGPDQEEIPFEIVSDAVVISKADISELEDGSPLRLEDENFARDLTILKTYDTFFEGVDFATATPADIEAAVLAGLEQDTLIYLGSQV